MSVLYLSIKIHKFKVKNPQLQFNGRKRLGLNERDGRSIADLPGNNFPREGIFHNFHRKNLEHNLPQMRELKVDYFVEKVVKDFIFFSGALGKIV